ncbi:MAG TPA: hypothetical protein PK771_04545 [Spirochaetota bacterium]|nr:hypothetical protein [Spirochaetota bacterium]
MKKYLILTVICILLLVFSCKKEKSEVIDNSNIEKKVEYKTYETKYGFSLTYASGDFIKIEDTGKTKEGEYKFSILEEKNFGGSYEVTINDFNEASATLGEAARTLYDSVSANLQKDVEEVISELQEATLDGEKSFTFSTQGINIPATNYIMTEKNGKRYLIIDFAFGSLAPDGFKFIK